MCLSDLELDYINPFDSASSINKFVLVEFIIQGSLCAVYLLTGHWLMALINAPMVYYHANLYVVLFFVHIIFFGFHLKYPKVWSENWSMWLILSTFIGKFTKMRLVFRETNRKGGCHCKQMRFPHLLNE